MSGYFTEELLRSNGIETSRIRSDFAKARIRSFDPGSTLLSRGSMGGNLYFVVAGLLLAEVESSSEQKANIPILALTEGSWAGAGDILAGRASSFSYVSATDLTIVEFPCDLVLNWADHHAEFRKLMTRLCLEESDRFTQALIPIKMGGTVFRIVCALASLADGFERGLHWRSRVLATTSAYAAGVTVAVPQSTLAALCGVSRSVLSPILQPLKQSGWLQLEYGATHICRPAVWAKLADKLRRNTRVDSSVPIDWAISELQILERGCPP